MIGSENQGGVERKKQNITKIVLDFKWKFISTRSSYLKVE